MALRLDIDWHRHLRASRAAARRGALAQQRAA